MAAEHPWLEVGVGSGRFAAALGVEVGVDPAAAPLRLAKARGIQVIQASGEDLPLAAGSFGAVVLVVTLCFTATPAQLLSEAKRVLRNGGALVIGAVPLDSAWGRWYEAKGRSGNPFYSHAHFLTCAEHLELLDQAGFELTAARSTLMQSPSELPEPEVPMEGVVPGAGFLCLQARPRN